MKQPLAKAAVMAAGYKLTSMMSIYIIFSINRGQDIWKE
jgi:hypothetical protein